VIQSEQWLVIFSHGKNAIRKADWMYRFFHNFMWKYTVLCKSNASEMREFRSLFTLTFQESSHESSSHNSKPFERNFPWTKNAISSNFRYETKFHDDKRRFTKSVHEISLWTDTAILHTIYSIYPSYNVREIYKRFSTHSLTGVQSRTQRMRITSKTYCEWRLWM